MSQPRPRVRLKPLRKGALSDAAEKLIRDTTRPATPTHVPTAKSRKLVSDLVSFGNTMKEIAAVLGISDRTLDKHYRKELDTANVLRNAEVAGRLFRRTNAPGMQGVVSSMFWLKARAGWSDKTSVEVTGANGGPIRSVEEGRALTHEDRAISILKILAAGSVAGDRQADLDGPAPVASITGPAD